MDEHQLNDILRVVDEPRGAPESFKAELLDELRGELVRPTPGADARRTVMAVDELTLVDEVDTSPSPGRRHRRARWIYALSAAAAAVLLVVFVSLRSPDLQQPPAASELPPPIVPQITPEVACADLLEATVGFDELAALAPADRDSTREQLQIWLVEIDRLWERTGASASADVERQVSETRILIRQAIDVTEPALVNDIDQQWRTVTSADGSLAACRR